MKGWITLEQHLDWQFSTFVTPKSPTVKVIVKQAEYWDHNT